MNEKEWVPGWATNELAGGQLTRTIEFQRKEDEEDENDDEE